MTAKASPKIYLTVISVLSTLAMISMMLFEQDAIVDAKGRYGGSYRVRYTRYSYSNRSSNRRSHYRRGGGVFFIGGGHGGGGWVGWCCFLCCLACIGILVRSRGGSHHSSSHHSTRECLPSAPPTPSLSWQFLRLFLS